MTAFQAVGIGSNPIRRSCMDALVTYKDMQWECLGISYSPWGKSVRMDCRESCLLNTGVMREDTWFALEDITITVIEYPE